MRVVCFILALFMAGAPLCAYEQINIVGNYKSFSYKKPVATAEHGARVYVLDKDYGRLAIFTSGEKLPSFVGSTGEGKDQFSEPSGLAILESRNLIFVADTGNNRIQILNENGQFLGSFGGSGSDQGRMSAPGAVAVGIDGRVYVADTGNDRIDVFTPDGIYMFDFPIASPSAIAADPGGNIYVLGAGTNEVIKFDPDGKKLASIKIKGDNFCVTKTGFLYVSSYEDGKIREYTPDGNFSGEFGTRGKAAGQFYKLSGISVAGNGDIIVSDYGQKTVSRINFVNSTKYPEITASTATRIMLSGPAENKGRQTQFPFTVYEGGSVWYNTETKAFFTDQSSKTAFGAYGKNTGETREPEGIADYKGKTFYVSDSGNNRIQVFSHEGKLLKVIGEKTGFMGSSSKEGRMNKPAGLAVESNGNVTVADEGNSRIQQFSKDGMFICAMGPKIGDKKFSRPVAVVILPDSHRLVLDRSAKKVFELFPTGALARYWGSEGSKPGQFIDPVSMAYDGREFIYVLDAGDARVKVFNLKGEYQGAFFAKGKGPGEYEEPKQIAFFKNGLYITDPALGKNDFYTFDVSPAPPSSATVTVNEDSVNLVWQESDSNWLSGYKVYRSTQTDGTYTLVASTSATEVTETGLKAPLTYYYKIAAVSQTGTEGLKSQAIETFVPGNLNVPKLSLDKTDIGYIFSANYKYYLKNPIGTIELSNNTDKAFKDVKLSFEMKEFMDFPFDTMIKRIPARDKVVVPIVVTLNNKVLDISEDTPVQAKLTAVYFMNEREREQTITVPVKVLSRYAIIWDRADRLGNFITPKDPPVFEFAKTMVLNMPKKNSVLLDKNIAIALALWSGAGSYGIKFMSDPNSPYETIKSSGALPVDTVQMPRDTLRLKSGECDDLTAFFTTLFEGAGVRTALLDYPSHIAFMFDTGKATPEEAGMPGERMIKYENTWWVPVETTMVGRSFSDATKQAITTYNRATDEVKIYPVQKAWTVYEPVTLPKTEWRTEMPPRDEVTKMYAADAEKLADERFEFLHEKYERDISDDQNDFAALNSLGILYAEYGKADEAEKYFQKVLQIAPFNAAALNNMGNIKYGSGDFKDAQLYYKRASESDSFDGKVLLNMARAAYKMGNKKEAAAYLEKAVKVTPDLQEMADLIKLQ